MPFKMQLLILWAICCVPYVYGRYDLEKMTPGFPVRKFDIVCKLNEEICDTQCFNPATHKCLISKPGSFRRLCQLDQTLCGNQCWSESDGKICTPAADGVFQNICERGELSCGWNCYNPEEKECFDQQWVCPKGQLSCRNECYSPSDPVKCLRSQYQTDLCKSDEEICGSWGCYNPNEKTCFASQDMLCTNGHQLCGRDCYNPTAGDTCNNGTYGEIACKAGEKLCKNSCYDPTKGKICANDVQVCNSGETNCGDQGCYVPSSGAQCFEAREDYHVVCDKGKDYCYYNCYEPGTEACMNVEGQEFKQICPIGHQICNGKLNSYTWGYGCYDPAISNCLRDKKNSYVLCNKGESLCGTICYTPTNDGLVCRENGSLCKSDDELCGHRCYDSATEKCFRNVKSDIQWG